MRYTTEGLLLLLGATCFVAFFATLHTFYFVLFAVAAAGTWCLVYTVLSRVRASLKQTRGLCSSREVAVPVARRRRLAWAVYPLRWLVDLADDRLHAWEVSLRNEAAHTIDSKSLAAHPQPNTRAGHELERIRRTARPARVTHRHITAAAFDRRFA